jgi:hypothetical protein
MGLLLGFAPFIIFVLLTGISVHLALWVALAASFTIAIRDFAPTRQLRTLDIGGTALFAALALYAGFVEPALPVQAVRLAVDGGFAMIALASLLAGNPFTLEYARDHVPCELWNSRTFLKTNYILAAVWSAAFCTMTALDAAATFGRHFAVAPDLKAGLVVLSLAIVFTVRYPEQIRAQAMKIQPLH